MATRTIANGGGNWSATGSWVEGAVPTAADEVVATGTSGSLTIDATAACRSINLTNYTATLTHSAGITLSIGDATAGTGNVALKFVSGMTYTYANATTSILKFVSTSATVQTIDFGGKTTPNVTYDGVGGSWRLSATHTSDPLSTITVTNGAFDASTQNLSIGRFGSNNSNIRTVAMGSGTWSMTGNNGTIWNFGTTTNLTWDAGTSTINFTYNGSVGTRTISAQGTSFPFNHFKVSAGSDAFTTSALGIAMNDLDFTGFTGTWNAAGMNILGNFILGAGMTTNSNTNGMTFKATAAKTIKTNGVQINRPITFDGVGGSWTLQDALDMSGASPRLMTLTNGSFDAAGYNVSCGTFASSNTNVRSLSLGSGTWTMNGTSGSIFGLSVGTNLTFNAGTSTVVLTDTGTSDKTFHTGASRTWNTVTITPGGTGKILFGGSTVIANLNLTGGSKSVQINSGSTVTVTNNFNVSGTAGNLVTFTASTAGTKGLLYKPSGRVSCDYLSLMDSGASGGGEWYAGANSTNVSNNSGWLFEDGATARPEAFLAVLL